MIYDLRRTRGIIAVMLTTVVFMAIYSLILHTTLRSIDSWLHEQGQAATRIEFRLKGGIGRILGLVRASQARPPEQGQRLGLLVGSSALYQGIDPYQLGALLGGPFRWANIPCSHQADENLLMAQLVYSRGLRPDVLILFNNPGIMVADIDAGEERGWNDPSILCRHLAHRQFGEARDDLLQISYAPFRIAFPYRAQIRTLIDRSFFAAKLWIFQAWGSGLD
jgi:hypothetical protein